MVQAGIISIKIVFEGLLYSSPVCFDSDSQCLEKKYKQAFQQMIKINHGKTYIAVAGLNCELLERLGATREVGREALVKPIAILEVETGQVVLGDGFGRGTVPNELETDDIFVVLPAAYEIGNVVFDNILLLTFVGEFEDFVEIGRAFPEFCGVSRRCRPGCSSFGTGRASSRGLGSVGHRGKVNGCKGGEEVDRRRASYTTSELLCFCLCKDRFPGEVGSK